MTIVAVDGVWEHLVVTVDRVALLDQAGAVTRTWHRQPGDPHLYDELVLAGLPLWFDPGVETIWAVGHPDTIRLAVDPTSDQALVLAVDGEAVHLPADLATLILHWYRTHAADGCE
ncbi:hypothetical protein GCM10010174_80530 [Kutzneria viridogrisea]|uniref:Uncharacterized protein n=1 Tax=Kutzneria viridogrisea TaxID=47990 RepID=A0ABR6BYX4_9PSEU|nr:hypothetical protein [Kutzneria viridogrisea]